MARFGAMAHLDARAHPRPGRRSALRPTLSSWPPCRRSGHDPDGRRGVGRGLGDWCCRSAACGKGVERFRGRLCRRAPFGLPARPRTFAVAGRRHLFGRALRLVAAYARCWHRRCAPRAAPTPARRGLSDGCHRDRVLDGGDLCNPAGDCVRRDDKPVRRERQRLRPARACGSLARRGRRGTHDPLRPLQSCRCPGRRNGSAVGRNA